jgi:hypothetical protein
MTGWGRSRDWLAAAATLLAAASWALLVSLLAF